MIENSHKNGGAGSSTGPTWIYYLRRKLFSTTDLKCPANTSLFPDGPTGTRLRLSDGGKKHAQKLFLVSERHILFQAIDSAIFQPPPHQLKPNNSKHSRNKSSRLQAQDNELKVPLRHLHLSFKQGTEVAGNYNTFKRPTPGYVLLHGDGPGSNISIWLFIQQFIFFGVRDRLSAWTPPSDRSSKCIWKHRRWGIYMSASMFEPSRFITAFKLYLLSDFSQRTTPLTGVWLSAFKGLERALKSFVSHPFWFPLTNPEIPSLSRYSQTPWMCKSNCLTWQSNDKRKVWCCKLFWNL